MDSLNKNVQSYMLTKIKTIFMTHLLFVKDLSHFVGELRAGKQIYQEINGEMYCNVYWIVYNS